MIRVLWFIVFIAIVASGAAWLADRPGDVAVVWHGYRIETSVAVAVVAFLAAIVTAVAAWMVLRLVFRAPDFVNGITRGRRQARGFTALSRGLVAVGSGDPTMAKRYAVEAEKLLGREPMTLLLRAQAAQLAGDRKTAETAFRAMLEQPETRVLGLRGLYVEMRRKGDLPAAYAFAGQATQIDASVGWANEAMLEHYGAQRRWRDALTMLERRLAAGRVDKDVARRQRAILLTADGIDRADTDAEGALEAVRQATRLAPDLVPAIALHGRLLSRQGALRKAAKVLETGWKINPHPDIAAAYIDLRAGDSALDRLERARTLQRLTPGHEEARIIVARAAIDAREFDRAQAVLEPLLRLRPPARVCLMMAEIAENAPAGSGQVREWLARASRAPRDPSWIADGVVSDHWEPLSPVTGKLDAFVWAAPTELLGHHPAHHGAEDVIADVDEAASAGYLAGQDFPAAAVTHTSGRAGEMRGKGAPAVATVEYVTNVATVMPATPAKSPAPASGPATPQPGVSPGIRSLAVAADVSGMHGQAGQPMDTPATPEPQVAAKQLASKVAAATPTIRQVTAEAPAGAGRITPRTEVIFPIARAPDDPGPGAEDDGIDAGAPRRIHV